MSLPQHISEEIAEHLEAIQRLFKNSKATLLMRAPGFPEGNRDLVMTDDDLGEAIRALEIRRAAGVNRKPS